MKLKELETALESLQVFSNPKIKLEQYCTRPHVAARVLHTIQSSYGDIEDKLVADLGCGTGSLLIGASLLEASFCTGFDIDSDALDICQTNVEEFEVGENIDLILQDIQSFEDKDNDHKFYQHFDTVILNPPFGTKNNKGIDIKFLKAALNLSSCSVYSFHKTSTRDYIKKKAAEWKVSAETLAELKFDIPASYKFHKLKCVDVNVDFWRFCHNIT